MKKVVNICLLFVGIFVFSLSTVYAFTFTRPLRLGSEGQDVLELQKILNSNPQTQISIDGAGSPGNETTYFGQKTLEAVKKFQNLHKKDVLEPVGLTEGTGYVGQSTISFLNTKYASTTGGASSTTQTTTPERIFDFGQVVDSVGGYVGNFQGLSTNLNKTASFHPDVIASHSGIIRSTRYGIEVDKKPIFIGASFKMQNQDPKEEGKFEAFKLGEYTLSLGKCYGDYACQVYLPGDANNMHKTTKTYKLHTNNPEHGSYDFQIVSTNVPYPKVSTDIVKLGQDSIVSGEHFTDDMRVFTPFGIYETDSLNNSFILNIDNSSTYMRDLESEATTEASCGEEADYSNPEKLKIKCPSKNFSFDKSKGALYVENKQGLRSNMKFVTYEK